METPILIAQIMGLTYLSIGLGMLINRTYYQSELLKLIDNSGIIIYGGYLALVFGMIILALHNSWQGEWTDMVTAIGYLAVIKGVALLVFPKITSGYRKIFLENQNFSRVMIPMVIILGLLFCYFGFFHV